MYRLLSLFFVLLASALPAGAAPVYTFGVVPQQATSVLAKNWTPVLAELSKRAGVTLRFATAPDIPEFEHRVATERYDFAYMNPYHYTVYAKDPGYKALARAKDSRLKGVLVVRKDSPFQNPAELDGQTLVFPAPAAFAASLMVKADLKKQGIVFNSKHVKSHESVYRNVAQGLYPAGGGVQRTFKLMDPKIADQLRVLWTTAGYTSHAIATRPGLDESVRERVWQAMQAMTEDPTQADKLARIGFKGFEPAADSDWDDIRKLDIQPEDTRIRVD